jgi:hypothetical protein
MRRFVIPIALVVAALMAALAQGEIKQQGNLRLNFEGRLTPKKLPRTVFAPVSVKVHGAITSADGGRPPQVSKIEFAFNREGRISTKGLPRCKTSELEGTTTKIARQHCGNALVGRGSFRAFVEVAGRKPVPFQGQALAFNSKVGDNPAVLLHIFGSTPTSVTFVLPFLIHRVERGQFGTVFIARPPNIASSAGYITDLEMTLDRTYSYRGEQRSFISARCAAPEGFPGAPFTLARGDFTFANGQQISTTLTDNCWVR